MAIVDFKKSKITELLNPRSSHYSVPDNQRSFSWGPDQVEDLFEDVKLTYQDRQSDKNVTHFMGMIVLFEDEDEIDKRLQIYDGQQRISNFILFFQALSDVCRDIGQTNGFESHDIYAHDIIHRFIIDPIGKRGRGEGRAYTITLGEQDDDFLKTYIYNRRKPPKQQLVGSKKLINDAYNYYYDETMGLIKETLGDEDFCIESKVEELIFSLWETVEDAFIFLVVKTDDINQAYEIFETLNARGKELETADLLKNHLLMNADPKYFGPIKNSWDTITSVLDSFNVNEVTRYIRYYWNSRYPIARERDLFRKLRKSFPASNVSQKRDLVKDLAKYVEHYRNLLDSDYSVIYNSNENMRQAIADLQQLGLMSYIPIVLAISAKPDIFSEDDLLQIINYLINYQVRNIIIGKQTANRNEVLFADIARKISNGEISNTGQIRAKLQENILGDEQFETLFKSYSTKKKGYIRYLLRNLNNKLAGTTLSLRGSEEVHIEHIFPIKSTNPEMAKDSMYQINLWRLGNLTLLLGSDNRSISNKSYDEKRAAYHDSDLRINQNLANEYKDWSYENIRDRQEKMAKLALDIWRL